MRSWLVGLRSPLKPCRAGAGLTWPCRGLLVVVLTGVRSRGGLAATRLH